MRCKQAGTYVLGRLDRELPETLYYHNSAHARDVCAAAERIGSRAGISPRQRKLLLTAAWFHDAGYLVTGAGHKVESCRTAQESLPAFGYASADIGQICVMIRATRVPQSPQNNLEEILADADPDYLGRDDFFEPGDRMYRELGNLSRRDWNAVQLNFLFSHSHFARTAQEIREAKTQEHILHMRNKLSVNEDN